MADFRGYMIGSFASSRLDRGGIPVVATTGKVSDASAAEPTVDFGINPCQWNSLPPEGILLWKVRHPVTETEASYPATIVRLAYPLPLLLRYPTLELSSTRHL